MNARSLILSDYTITIGNAANRSIGLNVSFTYNTARADAFVNAKYTHLFIRVVLASNQNIFTLPQDSFVQVQTLIAAPLPGNGYTYIKPSAVDAPMLGNYDFIAESQVRFTDPASVTPDLLATDIQTLVINADSTRQQLNRILSVQRVPMPTPSTKSCTITRGLMPIDNFEELGRVAFARIGEWKMIQSHYSSDYPVSYNVGVFNYTVGSAPACRIDYFGTQPFLSAYWLAILDMSQAVLSLAWYVQDFSTYQNTDSKIQPGTKGHYFLNYDVSDFDTPKYMCYGNAVCNPVVMTNAAELAAAAKTFYLSTRIS